jgi:hypothetical protein
MSWFVGILLGYCLCWIQLCVIAWRRMQRKAIARRLGLTNSPSQGDRP